MSDIRDILPGADADGTCEFVNIGTKEEPWVVLRHKENYKKFQDFCAQQPTFLECLMEVAAEKHD